ncbi:LLM class flavin-dependent oxidoreductase [Solicola gregarius]|uniref:LLM class flavin-dependent oxidoreductase n=1 Tax=Solicola gregarius TaxID=2908642 RepID=A0AA46TLV1_9ACTN|nr:LLM class flavin-dependent oxidoreductase [Solicola gregarius]UYM07445.1 LLM class flavin-dependent oxidoreductase [Solicola gregarius]
MTSDYGLEVEFGVFVTPDAGRVHETFELASLAEVSGLDLLTMQDHPYQSRFGDTWTLLSAIGARTNAIRISPNVASLPLRPPAVLAKSAATLDLVTGGRVELGLGAGAFWDAIAASGGARRTPREAVDALIEAIRIIRGFWQGGSLTVDGEHYRVHGMHAGPTPAHDIPIWLGAYKPRMLRATGELADAWVPSQGYAGPQELPDMNARIDEAAAAAGRAPQAIRRMYNVSGRFGTSAAFLEGSPADWAEQLTGLVLEQGMSTFILGSDDPDDVRRFASEVAPAVRELVAAERSRPDAHADDHAGDRAAESRRVPDGAEALTVHPTADDGTRLTGELDWDESVRPTTAPPADAAYTPAQQAVPQHLIDVHDGLRSELDQVRSVLGQVRAGSLQVGAARSIINTMAIRQNNWTLGAFCESYCRIVAGHHTLEDRGIFPHLRRAQPSLAPVLDRLEHEHEVIADVLEALDRALVGLVDDEGYGSAGQNALDELERQVDLLTDTLLSHLSYEERELLHPLAAHGFG